MIKNVNNGTCIIILAFNRLPNLVNLVSQISKQTQENINIFLDFYDLDFQEKCITHPKLQKCVFFCSESNLGLKRNVLRSFEYAKDFSDILVFEDDLQISSHLFESLRNLKISQRNKGKVAQLSLHMPKVNEFTGDGLEFYYNNKTTVPAQVPTSWGFYTTGKILTQFLKFLEKKECVNYTNLPMQCEKWGSQSWKLLFYDFMVKKNLYTFYPYVSLTSPASFEVGFNRKRSDFPVSVNISPVPVLLKVDADCIDEWHYNQFFEPQGELLNLKFEVPYSVQLSCTKRKENISTEKFVLTVADATKIVGTAFPLALKPVEANLFLEEFSTPTSGLAIGLVENFSEHNMKVPILANLDFGNKQIVSKVILEIVVRLVRHLIRKLF